MVRWVICILSSTSAMMGAPKRKISIIFLVSEWEVSQKFVEGLQSWLSRIVHR